MDFTTLGAIVIFALIVIGVIAFGLSLNRLIKKATKETAFVRTGGGGQKVVIDGIAFVIPVIHTVKDVNMTTVKIEVSRNGREALILKDKLRADVSATFFLKVKNDQEAIADAARTLGTGTTDVNELKRLIEDKLASAIRDVAANMTLSELHEQRNQFVQQVHATVTQDLTKNGLELESVSLTKLDQTDMSFLNPNNSFDAEGLTILTKLTTTKSKERNEIEQANRIAIEQRNFEANQQSLTIRQQDEFATLEQEREVETRRAAQEAELAMQRAARKREADIAQIEAARATELASIEAARLKKEADIATKQSILLAEQASTIEVNRKSEEESKSRAAADIARAAAVEASALVITKEQIAIAEREKEIAIIDAKKEAETRATGITVTAQAEFDAAELKAKARRIAADAEERENEVRANGERALAEAANSLSAEQAQLRIRLAAIEAAPKIVAELAKPMSAVKDARVVSISGFNNGNAIVTKDGNTGSGNIATDLSDAMLRFRLQSPVVDAIGKMAGLNLTGNLSDIVPEELVLPDHPIEVDAVETSELLDLYTKK